MHGGNIGPRYPRHKDVRKFAPNGQATYNRFVHATAQSTQLLVLSSEANVLAPPDPTRLAVAAHRLGPSLRLLWWASIPRDRFQASVIDGVRRVRIKIKDAYEGPDGRHNGAQRYIYLPDGVKQRHVKADGGPPETWTAVGCTCTDMIMRGAADAKGGCKHILFYNKHVASGTIVPPP